MSTKATKQNKVITRTTTKRINKLFNENEDTDNDEEITGNKTPVKAPVKTPVKSTAAKNAGKYLIKLVDINILRVIQKYGLDKNNQVLSDDQSEVQNTTKLSELNHEHQTPKIYPFLDETKRLHNCNVSMIDFDSGMKVSFLRYNCFWDRHPFDTRPIGCPILYCPDQVEKTYWSCISKDQYTIRESITKLKDILGVKVLPRNAYITKGVFCSYNCTQAYILDNKHKRIFDQSAELLANMYNDQMGTKNVVINPAPHWETLIPYGGDKNILKFREGFNNVTYEYHGMVMNYPKFIPTYSLYEEKLNF